MLNNKLNGYMCELFSIGVKNEPAIKFVTDFWDNPRICCLLCVTEYILLFFVLKILAQKIHIYVKNKSFSAMAV